jgi:serine/threonine protein kinase
MAEEPTPLDGQLTGALVGTVLADTYRLTRVMAVGGMGAVYEGKNLKLGRRVAVKVMARELVASSESLARFHREAEVTSRLGHPHIVSVLDTGSAPSGEPYLVMEFLEGETLDKRLTRLGKLPLPFTVEVVRQTAAALSAAHAQGVVHRDLKPANVFLVSGGDFVKVVDFGISKVKAATTRITRTSMLMGTPDYMSPEQAQGNADEVDHWSDQWSLAAMTYEMLAGVPPFQSEDTYALLYQVAYQQPPRLASKTDVPPEIDAIVMRGLSKKPAERYPDIAAFSKALEDAAPKRAADPLRATVAYGAPAARMAAAALPRAVEPAPAAPVAAPLADETTGEVAVPYSYGPLRSKAVWIAAGVALLIAALVIALR